MKVKGQISVKAEWMDAAKKFFQQFAKEVLGLPAKDAKITLCKAGPAVSGEVIMVTPQWEFFALAPISDTAEKHTVFYRRSNVPMSQRNNTWTTAERLVSEWKTS